MGYQTNAGPSSFQIININITFHNVQGLGYSVLSDENFYMAITPIHECNFKYGHNVLFTLRICLQQWSGKNEKWTWFELKFGATQWGQSIFIPRTGSFSEPCPPLMTMPVQSWRNPGPCLLPLLQIQTRPIYLQCGFYFLGTSTVKPRWASQLKLRNRVKVSSSKQQANWKNWPWAA